MSTVQQLFTDVNLRYRHTFTDAQMTVWFNEIENQLFEMFEIDSEPYGITLVADTFIYPIPSGVEVDKIKVMTIQINDADEPTFQELPFKRNDNNEYVNESSVWCTIISDNFFINAPEIIADRVVYIYLDTTPTTVVSTSLDVTPSTPYKYQGLLKLKLLQRVAEARKDVIMASNFTVQADEMAENFVWSEKMNEPEFAGPVDMMPRSSRYRNERRAVVITQTE